jgi:hypothetical protein
MMIAASRAATGLIVAVGDRDEREARDLAAATGRPFTAVESLDQVPPLVQPHLSHAVLVGAPAHFTVGDLNRLAAVTAVPLGVLSGMDRRETGHMVERTLARVAAPDRSICVDAINGAAFVSEGNGRAGRFYRRWAASLGPTFSTAWSAAVLSAHGGCNHLNLHRTVLCGITEGGSEWPGDHRGCWSSGRRRVCKRARADQAVRYLSELQAQVIALLTCSGFSLNGELFPSRASLVRAGTAGGAAAILTTTRLYAPQLWEAAHVTRSLDRGRDLAWITAGLNAYHHRRFGVRPYLVFGDPGYQLHPGVEAAARRSPSVTGARAAGKRPDPEAAEEAVEERLALDHARIEDRLRIVRSWSGALKAHTPRRPSWDRLFQQLDQANDAFAAAVLVPSSRRSRLRARCDHLAARFLLGTAFDLAVEDAWVSALRMRERSAVDPCQRCGCLLTTEIWGTDGRPDCLRSDCPTCGFRQVGPAKGAPTVTLSPNLRPGGQASLTLSGAVASLGRGRFWVVLRCKKGNRVFFRHETAVSASPLVIRFRVPATLTYDSHVAAWAYCGDLQMWYGRALCSSLTPGSRRIMRRR